MCNMPRGRPTEYDKEDCINALKKVAEDLGKSPTHSEWREKRKEYDLPSYSVIVNIFGSWNKAKENANLETNPQHSPIVEKPDNILLSDEEWESKKYSGKRSDMKRVALLAKKKKERGCFRCGYNKHEAALEFHHPEGRESVSLGKKRGNLDDILQEAEECKVVCGNCHNILHREKDYIKS